MCYDMSLFADEQERTLQICNLPSWADEEYLGLCFYLFHAVPPYLPGQHGRIIWNEQEGCSSSCGFMTFETRIAAERILRLYNGLVTMPGTKIRFCLKWAFSKSEGTPSQHNSSGPIKSSCYLRRTPVQFINNEKKTPESGTSILSTAAEIPLDAIENIMLRLPVKSIRRFRGVCKAWASLMSGPDFIYRHLENQRSICNGIVALGRINKKQYNTYFFSDYSMESICCIRTMHFKFPHGFTHTTPSYEISNSCNGLVCVYNENFASVINPTIQETVQLPKSLNFPKHANNEVSVGLGYDDCLDTYKIVRMMKHNITVNSGIRYEVMDLGSANCNWRLLGCITGYRVVSLIPPVFVHGAIYWLISNSDLQEAIFSFDVRTETVRLISVPEARTSYNLIVMEECLCILYVYKSPIGRTKVANLYVLEDSVNCEWIKKCTIEDITILFISPILNCDGKIFVTLARGESLEQHYYDTENGSRGKRTVLSCASRNLIRLESIRACTQSLVSPISYLQRSNTFSPIFHLFGQKWATVFPTSNSSSSRSHHHI
ncbi:hypothetical protein LUZ63_003775 [Rhynchospora breviuscula]|uniref:F-box domain-containing protein n=1 Tax=Rhynchospora breviuscula TaxID=2022672 RepID=A0A9Q0D179_9POAL|nr:hypothetical protein LUZ63_003775 [Rhynchospora breviuscula]